MQYEQLVHKIRLGRDAAKHVDFVAEGAGTVLGARVSDRQHFPTILGERVSSNSQIVVDQKDELLIELSETELGV